MADVHLEETTPAAIDIVNLLPQAAVVIQECFARLGTGRMQSVQPLLIQIHEIENAGDVLFRRARAALATPEVDSTFRYHWDYIYTNLEDAIDGCEHLADVLEGISNKYA